VKLRAFAGGDTRMAVIKLFSASVSFAKTPAGAIDSGVSSSVEYESATALGALLRFSGVL